MRLVTARNGTSVESPFSDMEALSIVGTIKGNNFAEQLFSKASGVPDRLSLEQRKWLHILAVQITEKRGQATILSVQRGQPQTVSVGSLKGLADLLQNASKSLKTPKLRVSLGQGEATVVLKLRKGAIQITDAEKTAYNDRFCDYLPLYYGKVTLEGEFTPFNKNRLKNLDVFLKLMSENPVETAQAYGKMTGNCCFCGLPLSDARSTQVGYGKTCAKHWGMPWGEKEEAATVASRSAVDEVMNYVL